MKIRLEFKSWRMRFVEGAHSIYIEEANSEHTVPPLVATLNGWHPSENVKNARLIVAAPEFYKASKQLVATLGLPKKEKRFKRSTEALASILDWVDKAQTYPSEED